MLNEPTSTSPWTSSPSFGAGPSSGSARREDGTMSRTSIRSERQQKPVEKTLGTMKTTRSSPWPTNLVFPSTSPRHGLPPSHTQDTCSASSTGEQVCPPSKWPPTAPTSTLGSHNQFIGSKMPNASLADSSTHPASPVVLDAPRHLTRLIGFVNIAVRSNAHPRAQRHGSAALDKDIEWWREHLCGEEVWRSFSQYAPKDINLFVDASSDWELVFGGTGTVLPIASTQTGDHVEMEGTSSLPKPWPLRLASSMSSQQVSALQPLLYTRTTRAFSSASRADACETLPPLPSSTAFMPSRSTATWSFTLEGSHPPTTLPMDPVVGSARNTGLPTIVLPAPVAAEFLPHWQSPAGSR
ncbi:unnamed protein product [Tilletia laevis]|uniref:Uncharacterized protein n=2 Tax=Tilletia TaxID=13289 RepID=A0ABN7IZB2_9BASI|nr:unnamed protein product [Tilletia caries]CAD6936728.1 unnamed protein product [Tilletia laevis]